MVAGNILPNGLEMLRRGIIPEIMGFAVECVETQIDKADNFLHIRFDLIDHSLFGSIIANGPGPLHFLKPDNESLYGRRNLIQAVPEIGQRQEDIPIIFNEPGNIHHLHIKLSR